MAEGGLGGCAAALSPSCFSVGPPLSLSLSSLLSTISFYVTSFLGSSLAQASSATFKGDTFKVQGV